MNNEPVAWMTKWGDGTWSFQTELRADEVCIPLYTYPAKTLTDEVILQEAENMFGTYFFESIDDPYWIEFARAILRKAQEK
jgi:hypothetical protein